MNKKMIPVAGIDVSKDFSDMCILAPDNIVFRRVKIFHDRTSMERSLIALREAEEEFEAKPVLVMESTSHYHRLLWQFMTEAGYEVIVINPIQSGGLKNINVRKVKNDQVDAFKLALLYRLKTLRPSLMPKENVAALRDLSRQHVEVMNDVTRYTNRLRAMLDQSFPGYASVFPEPGSTGSLAVLEWCATPDELLAADEDAVVNLLKKSVSARTQVGTAEDRKTLGLRKVRRVYLHPARFLCCVDSHLRCDIALSFGQCPGAGR